MALTEKERLKKLSKANTSKKLYDLYQEVFNDEFPIVELRNPMDKLELLIDAIETNKKVQGVELPESYNI